jgi:hypothetical protein
MKKKRRKKTSSDALDRALADNCQVAGGRAPGALEGLAVALVPAPSIRPASGWVTGERRANASP